MNFLLKYTHSWYEEHKSKNKIFVGKISKNTHKLSSVGDKIR